jgi:hypothetical protein
MGLSIRVPASDWLEVYLLASWVDLLQDAGPPIHVLA